MHNSSSTNVQDRPVISQSSGQAVGGGNAKRSGGSGVFSFLFRFLLPLVALVIGGWITMQLLETGPQAKQLPKRKNATFVETKTFRAGTYPTTISAMGTVTAAQSINLRPQATGEVLEISESFVPGGRFSSEQILLQLDPSDYHLNVRQRASEVAQAQNDVELENGNQIVAQREFELLGEQVSEVEKKLMLRKPQLRTLETALDIARAKYEQAQLDLARTTLRAPFNGIVQSRGVNVGTRVSLGENLAALIGTDRYWVEVSVAEEQLQWITVPQKKSQEGSKVKIYNPTAWGNASYREGTVIQLLPGLETQGRMARLLIEVDDPLALEDINQGKPQLLVDSFVRVAIQGTTVSPAIALSREYLRNGENIWLFQKDGTLEIRQVSIAFKNKDKVLIAAGVEEETNLITSSIAAPVTGMLLKRAPVSEKPGNEKRSGNIARQEKRFNQEDKQ